MLQRQREPGAFLNGSEGIQLPGFARAAYQVALNFFVRELFVQTAIGFLTSADHDVVHGKRTRFTLNSDMQSIVVDAIVSRVTNLLQAAPVSDKITS